MCCPEATGPDPQIGLGALGHGDDLVGCKIGGVFEGEVEHVGIGLEFCDCGEGRIGGRRGVGVEHPVVGWDNSMETEEDSCVGEFGGEGFQAQGQGRRGC